jgi:hypothetical protein
MATMALSLILAMPAALFAAPASRPAPALVLLSSETLGDRAVEFHLHLRNWKDYPVEDLTARNALPPNPCRMSNAPQRVWLEIYRTDGSRAACMPVTKRTTASFSFRDYEGHHPDIYVVVTDIRDGASWRSQTLSTSSSR